MKGPHRKQSYQELCAIVTEACRRPASVACLRCGAPLCDVHVPPPHQRCGGCEADFAGVAERAHLLRAGSRIASIASIGGGLAIGIASGLSAGATAGFTLLSFAAVHWFRMLAHLSSPESAGKPGLLRGHRRRRFLRERGSNRLLGA